MPLTHMGQWRYISTVLDLDTRWAGHVARMGTKILVGKKSSGKIKILVGG
jgi:hypothetical protein